jgi:deazaflavin-dependent oxidoreductase (nitroreductase family)
MSDEARSYNQQIIDEFHANAGTVGAQFEGRELLLLHTTGARSGEERISPLVSTRDGDDLVITASAGGAAENPAWFHNLVAHPRVTVEFGPETFDATATVVEDRAERDRLFAGMVAAMPGFGDYERMTERLIPVIVLRRLPSAPAVTEEPMADIREMYMAHDMFRREFTLLPALVRGVSDGDRERTLVVADHLALVDTLLYHHHHSEDTHLWPRLLDRGADDIEPLVRLMEGQHERIEEINAEVVAAARAWRDTPAAGEQATLADALDRLVTVLGEHMAAEEEHLLPLIEKYITAAEWGAMTAEGGADVAPESLPLLFGMMMYEGDPEVIDIAVASMPAEARPVIRNVAAQAFAAHSERVHGTPTPPRGATLTDQLG